MGQMNVKLTEDERTKIEIACKVLGLSFSSFLRSAALEKSYKINFEGGLKNI